MPWPIVSWGQRTSYTWDDFVRDCTMEMEMQDEADEDDWRERAQDLEELQRLHEHPMNINTATVDDLLRLPFLDEGQVEQIHAYIYLHGALQTLGELRLIPMLTPDALRALPLFVRAESQPTVPQKSHWGGQLTTRMDIPTYYREGYQRADGYAGDALYHRAQLLVSDNQHFQIGGRLEKDAGERYYDTYGAYFQLSDYQFIKRAIVGDYRAGFGQGLVLGGNAFLTKSGLMNRSSQGVRALTGMDEVHYLHGAASTFRLTKELSLTALVSHRWLDATLTDEGAVQTFRTTGYHRTASEIQARDDVGQWLTGGNLEWQHKGLHLGATGYWQRLSRPLEPGDQLYRQWYPRGSQMSAAGLSYGYSRYRLTLNGETALSHTLQQTGWSTLNRLSWVPSRRLTLGILQRYYDKKYYSQMASAISESGGVRNESGVLLNVQAQPWNQWQLQGYLDFFYNPWPRYGMTHNGSGQEGMLQATFTLNATNTLTARYQVKRKESQDLMDTRHRVRLQWTCTPTDNWRFQTEGSLHQLCTSGVASERPGWAILEKVQWQGLKDCLRLSGMVAYFNTPSYANRIFITEPVMLQTFSHQMLYGQGMRTVAIARYQTPARRWLLEGRWGSTFYFDRSTQGTGLQTIHSWWRGDISILLRVTI